MNDRVKFLRIRNRVGKNRRLPEGFDPLHHGLAECPQADNSLQSSQVFSRITAVNPILLIPFLRQLLFYRHTDRKIVRIVQLLFQGIGIENTYLQLPLPLFFILYLIIKLLCNLKNSFPRLILHVQRLIVI